MANIKEKMKPATIVLLVIYLIVLIATIVGVCMNYIAYKYEYGSISETYLYKISGAAAEEGTEIDEWSQLSNLGIVKFTAYGTIVLAALVLVLQIVNIFVNKGYMYILNTLVSVLLFFCGIFAVVAVWGMFGTNAEGSMLGITADFQCAIGAWILGVAGVLGGAIASIATGSAYKKYKLIKTVETIDAERAKKDQ